MLEGDPEDRTTCAVLGIVVSHNGEFPGERHDAQNGHHGKASPGEDFSKTLEDAVFDFAPVGFLLWGFVFFWFRHAISFRCCRRVTFTYTFLKFFASKAAVFIAFLDILAFVVLLFATHNRDISLQNSAFIIH